MSDTVVGPLKRRLGRGGPVVSAVGFGAWPLSDRGRPCETDAIKVLHRALDLGVTLIDTADAYCLDDTETHHNERLVRRALETYTGPANLGEVVVATKGGLVRPGGRWIVDTSAGHLTATIAESHEALSGGTQPIHLWQVHSMETVDAEEIEELFKPVQEAILNGTIKHVGLSNCNVEHIKRAQLVLPEGALLSVQNEFSMWCRDPERDGVLEYCQAEGLAFLPYAALGGDLKRRGGRSLRDRGLFPAIGAVVDRTGASAEQVSLAWMLAKWSCVVHIAGARHVSHLENSVASAMLTLTTEEVEAISRDGPGCGSA